MCICDSPKHTLNFKECFYSKHKKGFCCGYCGHLIDQCDICNSYFDSRIVKYDEDEWCKICNFCETGNLDLNNKKINEILLVD